MTTDFDTLWLFWGQAHMSFLRYITILSAKQVHSDVRLIVRDGDPVRGQMKWIEKQDFMSGDTGHNWLDEAKALVGSENIIPLNEIAPEIAVMRADDIHTSDLLSWYLLANYGGTVADMDIVFIKPIPKVMHDIQVIKQHWPTEIIVPVGFMQGRPCIRWQQTFELAMRRYDPDNYQSCGTTCFRPHLAGQISPFVAYPWSGNRLADVFRWLFSSQTWPELPQECCAIHWYAGGNQHWNQKIKSYDDLLPGAMRWAIGMMLERAKERNICECQ